MPFIRPSTSSELTWNRLAASHMPETTSHPAVTAAAAYLNAFVPIAAAYLAPHWLILALAPSTIGRFFKPASHFVILPITESPALPQTFWKVLLFFSLSIASPITHTKVIHWSDCETFSATYLAPFTTTLAVFDVPVTSLAVDLKAFSAITLLRITRLVAPLEPAFARLPSLST